MTDVPIAESKWIESGELLRGAYDARRAAALSGVPLRTLHYWAQQGIYQPSVAPGPRNRLWSWSDLLALRAIDWFRHTKGPGEPPAATIAEIRRALDELEKTGHSPAELGRLAAISPDGRLFILTTAAAYRVRDGQAATPEILDLVRPYLNGRGPDLLQPRPLLRIMPGKLHGEPHLLDTRIDTAAVYTLFESGYRLDQIQRFYPEANREALRQAIEFEQSLTAPVA